MTSCLLKTTNGYVVQTAVIEKYTNDIMYYTSQMKPSAKNPKTNKNFES